MNSELKAKAIKLGAKVILKLTGLELLGEGGVFVYELGKDYLPEVAESLISATVDGGVDFFSDEAGDFAKSYLAKREKYVNFYLARGICKVWEENLTASLPKNRAANSKYFLLPQDSFQDFNSEIEFFIAKFKQAQEKGGEHLLLELFYDKDKSDEGFYDTFFAGVQNEISAEDAYWTTLEKTLRRWSIAEGKFRYDWKDGFPEDFRREMKKFLFGNLRVGLKEIFDKNEAFRNAFSYSATILTIKSLQNLPKEIREKFENAQSENRFNFSQIQIQLSDISKAIREKFNDSLNPEAVRRIDSNTQETNEIVKIILETLKNQPKSPPDIFKGLHKSFPRVPSLFTGRVQVLIDLEKTLEKENQASFYGTHGLGKTRTAIEYALRHQADYEFILFISATKGNFVNNAAFVGAEISEAIQNATTLEAKYNLFIKLLEERKNWLIICDNVEDILEMRNKIPKVFSGKVIYTSNLREIQDVAPLIKIEAMTKDEAELTLYRRKVGDNTAELENVSVEEREAISQIVEKIGTLPIGLNLAGAFIKNNQLNFREYLLDYEQFEEVTFQDFDIADYYGEEFTRGLSEAEKAEYKGIAGVFLLSYQRIIKPKDETERDNLISETIKAVLNLSVFLAPEKVPEEIWKEGLVLLDENLTKAAEEKLFWLKVRNRLTQSAFFVRNENENSSTTHRLILKILQKQLSNEEKRRFAGIAVDTVNNLFPNPVAFENWKTCNRLQRHAEIVLNHAKNLEIETQNAARIYNQIAIYTTELAEYEKAVIFYQEAMRIDEKTIGKEHPGYATDLINLANVYQSQGNLELAEKLFQQSKGIREKTLGQLHPDTAQSYWWIGFLRSKQQNYKEALPMFEEAYRQYVHFLGENHPDTQTLKGHLFLCRKRMQKDK